MAEETRTPPHKKSASHVRTSKRRQGVRLTKAETKEAQEKFLKSFAGHGNVRSACMAANVDRSTIRVWEEHDVRFSLLYNQSKADVDDAIRAEIYRRAMFGEEEYVTSMGKPVYEEIPVLSEDGTPKLDSRGKPTVKRGKILTHKRKSDLLLMFHAKARMAEYRDKSQVDVNTTTGTVEIYKIRIPDNNRDGEAGKGT